jgi:GNAT superfamily N-acetyltransferase
MMIQIADTGLESDRDAIMSILTSAFNELIAEPFRSDFALSLTKTPLVFMFIVVEGVRVGTFEICPQSLLLQNFAIVPHHRGKGLGTAALHIIKRLYPGIRVQRATLRAKPLYKRMGIEVLCADADP